MADITVNYGDEHQPIDGFGACDRNCGSLSDSTMDTLYSVASGIGLSLLRASFDVNGYNVDADPANAQKAVARGATVWGAPWSPPGIWKDNGDENNGGHLLVANYGNWSDSFVSFYNLMKGTYGVTVVGLSVQNEPDFSASYPSCIYTNSQMVAFIKVLGPKLAALSPPPVLISPEPSNWALLWNASPDPATNNGMANYILNDATASSYVGVLATHDYAYATVAPNTSFTQRLWETEVSTFDTFDPTITNGLTVASWIHRSLVTGNVNAWHYWELVNVEGDNEGLLASDFSVTKRLFVMGNWSRYVRPGWKRVGVTGAVSNVSVSAFKGPTGDVAIVAVNTGSPVSVSFALSGPSLTAKVSTHVTSGTSLGAIGTDGNLSSGSVSGSVPATVTPSANSFTVLLVQGVTTLTSTTASQSQVSVRELAQTVPAGVSC